MMSGGNHSGVDLRDTDLDGISVHSAGLVKMSSGDASSSSSGDEWGGHRGVDLRDTDLGGVSIHSAGLVKMSSSDASSSMLRLMTGV